jgi:hypothetical protein
MRQWLLFALLALLIADASGVIALAEPETCTVASTTEQGSDGGCAAFCVRCSCCAAPIVHGVRHILTAFVPLVTDVPRLADAPLPSGNGSEILHVPKDLLA